MKPPAGAGAVNTYRLEDTAQLEAYLARHPPDPRRPALFEEFLQGEEHSFDSVAINGRIVWYSISRYLPAPLTVLENAWIQWCVLLPREIEGPEYDEIRAAAGPALRALGLSTGMTHMEWFRRESGGIAISEVAARPPGAQFTTLISYASNLRFLSRVAAIDGDGRVHGAASRIQRRSGVPARDGDRTSDARARIDAGAARARLTGRGGSFAANRPGTTGRL